MQNQGEDNAEDVGTRVPAKPDSRSQQRSGTFFAILFFFALIGVVFGSVSIFKNIRSPFVPKAEELASLAGVNAEDTSQNAINLQNQDTDSDGLNDYVELYQYQTSPYLADSDSDGLTDKEEIESGNDPNCPTGQDCMGNSQGTNTNSAVSNNNSGLATNTSASGTDGLPVTATGEVDLVKLREILKNAGAPAYIVDGTDDATLLELYRETVAETATNTNSATNTSSTDLNTNSASLATLQNLTPAEIRALLVENGVDKASLDTVSDADLLQVYAQALIEAESANP